MNIDTLPKGVFKNGKRFSVYVPSLLVPTLGKTSVSFSTMEEAINKRKEWSKYLSVDYTPVNNDKDYGIDWSLIETSFEKLKGRSSIDKSLLMCIRQQLLGAVCIDNTFRFYINCPDRTRSYVLRTEDDIPFVKNVLAKAGYNTFKARRIKRDIFNIKACEEYKKDSTHITFTGKHYIVRLPKKLPEDFPSDMVTKFKNYEDAKALRDTLGPYYRGVYFRDCVGLYLKDPTHKADPTYKVDTTYKVDDTPVVAISAAKLEALRCLAHPDTDTHYAEDVYILNEKDHTYHHLGACSKFDILTNIVKCGTSEVVVLSKSTDGSYKVLNILN